MARHAVEGAQVAAAELAAHFVARHDARAFAPASRAPADTDGVLTPRSVGWRALWRLVRMRPEHVVYLPAHGITPAALVRAQLLWRFARPASFELITLQTFAGDIWLRRATSRRWTAVCANDALARPFATLGLATSTLAPRVAPDRISARSREAARASLGLPADETIYLHVGHARPGRNLQALEGLTAFGRVVIVLSPYAAPDAGSLPKGDRVHVVTGAVTDIGDYYRAADVYVFPTADQGSVIGLPMSVFEALANQTPVVARRSESLTRWEDEPGLFLVDDDIALVDRAKTVLRETTPLVFNAVAQRAACHGDFAVCQEAATR